MHDLTWLEITVILGIALAYALSVTEGLDWRDRREARRQKMRKAAARG